MKVLIGANKDQVAELYARILDNHGYTPIVTKSVADTLIRSKERDIGAVILDLSTVGNDELISRLEHLPLLATYHNEELESIALSEGAKYFVKRPLLENIDLIKGLKKALQYHYRESLAAA